MKVLQRSYCLGMAGLKYFLGWHYIAIYSNPSVWPFSCVGVKVLKGKEN